MRDLKRMARPSGHFDASRYFRGDHNLGFYNVGTGAMRALARSIWAAHSGTPRSQFPIRNQSAMRWGIEHAMAFADLLIVNRYLEVKVVAIEVVARYHRAFTPALLGRWKRWLAGNHSANWATTDAICGELVGPLLVQYPRLAAEMRAWSKHPNMWVRRASIVGLLPLARKGQALELLYEIAARLHKDTEDLIQKAVGWALREAGKPDVVRLERCLRANGPSIPRTTLRYAIERFPPAKRRALLVATKARTKD